jgi:hypothetical protein
LIEEKKPKKKKSDKKVTEAVPEPQPEPEPGRSPVLLSLPCPSSESYSFLCRAQEKKEVKERLTRAID